MIDRFLGLVRERAVPAQTQDEREALVDLLVWMMFADRHVAAAEQHRIATETRGMAWDAPAPVDHYVGRSILRARAVLAGERSPTAYLGEIAGRLADETARWRALQACRALAEADGEVAEAERRLLETFAAGLGLSAEPVG